MGLRKRNPLPPPPPPPPLVHPPQFGPPPSPPLLSPKACPCTDNGSFAMLRRELASSRFPSSYLCAKCTRILLPEQILDHRALDESKQVLRGELLALGGSVAVSWSAGCRTWDSRQSHFRIADCLDLCNLLARSAVSVELVDVALDLFFVKGFLLCLRYGQTDRQTKVGDRSMHEQTCMHTCITCTKIDRQSARNPDRQAGRHTDRRIEDSILGVLSLIQ